MDNTIKALVAMRKLAAEMERDLGIADLPEAQRLSLLAASDLRDSEGKISSAELRLHPLVRELARPTFFRAISALEEAGRLIRPKGVQRGSYEMRALSADE